VAIQLPYTGSTPNSLLQSTPSSPLVVTGPLTNDQLKLTAGWELLDSRFWHTDPRGTDASVINTVGFTDIMLLVATQGGVETSLNTIASSFGEDKYWTWNGSSGYRIPFSNKVLFADAVLPDLFIFPDDGVDTDATHWTYVYGKRSARTGLSNEQLRSAPIQVMEKGILSSVTSFTSTTSATIKNENWGRKVLMISNEGAGTLYVLYGNGTASSTSYSVKIASGGYHEVTKYAGQVNGIFSGSGTARITEIT